MCSGAHSFVFQQHIVGAIGVEGRVEVDEIDRLGGRGAEDGEVIAVIEGVHGGVCPLCPVIIIRRGQNSVAVCRSLFNRS